MRVNVYIRKEHEDTWDKLENKSQWVNDKLQEESPAGVVIGKPENPFDAPLVTEALQPMINKLNKDRLAKGTCKIHGLPLDNRGRCLQKGCRYA